MASQNLLDKVERQLEKIIEEPFLGAAPFDVKDLKRRLVSAIAEMGTPYVADHWYVCFPASLQKHDAEVRAWVDALWRSLVSGVERNQWAAGAGPRIDVSYDDDLPANQILVGYDYTPASTRPTGTGVGPRSEPPPATPAARVPTSAGMAGQRQPGASRTSVPRDKRRHNPFFTLAKVVVLVSLLGVGALLAFGPSLPRGIGAQVGLPPALPKVELPPLLFAQTRYVVRWDLPVRSKPSSDGAPLGVITRGKHLRFGDHNIVKGEVVAGEERWVDITSLSGYLTGDRRYIWYGGLEPE